MTFRDSRWDESKHPRDDIGRFTFKEGPGLGFEENEPLKGGIEHTDDLKKENSRNSENGDKSKWKILKDKLKDVLSETGYKDILLSVLEGIITPAQVLYSNTKQLEGLIVKNNLEGKLTSRLNKVSGKYSEKMNAKDKHLGSAVSISKEEGEEILNDNKSVKQKTRLGNVDYDYDNEYGHEYDHDEHNAVYLGNDEDDLKGYIEKINHNKLNNKKSLNTEGINYDKSNLPNSIKTYIRNKQEDIKDMFLSKQEKEKEESHKAYFDNLQKSKEELYGYLKELKKEQWANPLGFGIKLKLNSPYGDRYHPVYKRKIPHDGIDIQAKENTKVYATMSGKITYAGWINGYGKYIKIQRTNEQNQKVEVFYGHLNKIDVKLGQTVKRGDYIGLSGKTGIGTGAHLHYGMRINGGGVNPMEYIGHFFKNR